jgi:hypothetical protein
VDIGPEEPEDVAQAEAFERDRLAGKLLCGLVLERVAANALQEQLFAFIRSEDKARVLAGGTAGDRGRLNVTFDRFQAACGHQSLLQLETSI